MGYLGNPATVTGSLQNIRYSTTATQGQVTFNITGGYSINRIDVYRNGVKLVNGSDFAATDGSQVVLQAGAEANAGDIMQFVVVENYNVADALSAYGDQTLDGNLTVTGTLTSSGTLDASYATTAGISTSVKAGGYLGVGVTGTDVNITGIITGQQFSGNVTGTAATFTGNVTVGGTLTYDDVTNIDSVGLITARNGLQVIGGIATVTGQTSLANVTVSAASTFTGKIVASGDLSVDDQTTLSNTNVATGIVTVAGQTNLANVNVATGIVTVAGQTNLANLDVSGFSTANVNYFNNVAEKMVRVSAAGSIGICTYSSTANIIYFDAPNGDAVIKITGVPQDSSFDNSSIVVSAILRTTGTGRSVHPYLNINGVDRSIKFSGGSRNEATSGVTTTNGYTIYNFIGINTTGSASTAANYEVLGCVSGGFF